MMVRCKTPLCGQEFACTAAEPPPHFDQCPSCGSEFRYELEEHRESPATLNGV